jgi:hypothetical protein
LPKNNSCFSSGVDDEELLLLLIESHDGLDMSFRPTAWYDGVGGGGAGVNRTDVATEAFGEAYSLCVVS